MPMDGASPVNQQSSAESKIHLFRSLFRGRDDVYPRRFESRKTGKAGYAPACSNEWVRGICEKLRRWIPMLSVGLRPRCGLIASAMKHSGDLHLAIVPVIDDVIVDAEGANAGSELRTETSNPGLFRQEVEVVDDVVDEPVSGRRARVLGDV